MSKCKHCGYHLDMHSDLCERMQKEIARAEKAEAERDELKKLSSHGNGEILLGWMDAHRKAMDQLGKAEAERDVMAKRMMDISKEFVVISEHNIALKRRQAVVEAETNKYHRKMMEAQMFIRDTGHSPSYLEYRKRYE